MNINDRIQELGTMLPKCNEKYVLSAHSAASTAPHSSLPMTSVLLVTFRYVTRCLPAYSGFDPACSDKYNKGLILKETVDYINTLKQSQENLLSSNASLSQKLQVCAFDLRSVILAHSPICSETDLQLSQLRRWYSCAVL